MRAKRALLVFLAYFSVQFAGGIVAGIGVAIWYGVTRGLRAPGVIAEAMRTATILGAILGMIAGGWVVYRLVARRAEREGEGHPLAALGWSPGTVGSTLLALSIGVVLAAAYLAFLRAFPPPRGARAGLLENSIAEGGWPLYAWALLAVAIAPPIEEFVYRGVLWTGLVRSWRPIVAGTVVTGLFMAMHLTETWGNSSALIAIGAMGLAALAMRIATGSLVPPIFLHAGYNAVVAAVVLGSPP